MTTSELLIQSVDNQIDSLRRIKEFITLKRDVINTVPPGAAKLAIDDQRMLFFHDIVDAKAFAKAIGGEWSREGKNGMYSPSCNYKGLLPDIGIEITIFDAERMEGGKLDLAAVQQLQPPPTPDPEPEPEPTVEVANTDGDSSQP